MLKRRQIEWVLDHEAEPQLAFSARACSSPSSEGVGCARTHERPTAVVADLMCGKGRIGRQLHQKGWMLIYTDLKGDQARDSPVSEGSERVEKLDGKAGEMMEAEAVAAEVEVAAE